MKTAQEIKRLNLSDRVIALIEEARRKTVAAVNLAMVYTYYEIGRQIVEEEQGGKRRAGYGEKLIADLSVRLTARFGRGWSEPTLWRMRQFYLLYSNSLNGCERIDASTNSLNGVERIGKSATALWKCGAPKFTLSWSHYLKLMRIDDPAERSFYEIEARENNWSLRELQRQFDASLYERRQGLGRQERRRAMTAHLPKGWRYDRLKRVAVVSNGSDPVTEGDVPVYGSGGQSFKTCGEYKLGPAVLLGRKGTIDIPRYVEGKYWNVDTAFDVKPLGVCDGRAGAPRPPQAKGGRVGVPSPSEGGAADGGRGATALPASRGKIDIRFLYYVAHAFDYRFYSTQTTVPSMTQKDYRNMLLPLPPRDEQERIAAFLDAKCADVDKAIAAKRRQLAHIDEIWTNALARAVTQGLDVNRTFVETGDYRIPKLPTGWRLEKIARCFDLIGSGTTPKSHMLDYYDGEIPWLQSGDLHGRYIDHTEKCVNEQACEDCNLRIYKAPFIAVAMYGASIANLSIVRIDACTNQACCTLCEPRYLIDPDFAYFAIAASREALLQSAHGGTQPNISREVVRRLKVPLPPKKEQIEIAKYLDARRANLDALAENLRKQVETLEQYRKSLIHECVTGARRCG